MTSAEQSESTQVDMTKSPLVFISHSHRDEAIVREIYEILLELGVEPYATSVNRKEDFQKEIGEKLSQCDVFLLVASEAAFRSRWVIPEINEAINLGKKISYYRIDQASPPDTVARFLNMYQYIEVQPDNSNIFKVAEDVLCRSGLPEELVSIKINSVSQDRENKLNKWRDRLWSYMYDHVRRKRKSRLSTWERNKLNQLASQLKIRPSVKDEVSGYKRNRNDLVKMLTSALSKETLSLSDLQILEAKRLEYCISTDETIQIICDLPRIRSKASKIEIDQPALSARHWLNEAINLIRCGNHDEAAVASNLLQANRTQNDRTHNTAAFTKRYLYCSRPQELKILWDKVNYCSTEKTNLDDSPANYYYSIGYESAPNLNFDEHISFSFSNEKCLARPSHGMKNSKLVNSLSSKQGQVAAAEEDAGTPRSLENDDISATQATILLFAVIAIAIFAVSSVLSFIRFLLSPLSFLFGQ